MNKKTIILMLFGIFIGLISLLKIDNSLSIEVMDDDFKNVSDYNYNIYDKTMIVDNLKYKVIVAQDGVILIYNNSNQLVASSKKAVSTETEDAGLKTACISHFGEKSDGTGECNINFQNTSFTEESIFSVAEKKAAELSKYNEYASNEYYKGIDITGYNEALYNEYENKFSEVIRKIAIETTKLLDSKINGEYKTNGSVNSVGQTEIKLSGGQYLVNCDYYSYEYYNGYILAEKMDKIPGASETDDSKQKILGIYGFGIVIPSNVKLDLNGSVLKQIDDAQLNTTYDSRTDKSKYSSGNSSNQYEIFRIESGKNITITNGVLIGDKGERSTTEGGEKGTGIFVRTSGNIDTININNMIIKYMSGDGIDIDGVASSDNNTYTNTGITIEDNYIYACNRQGISIEYGRDMTIKNNVIYNIIGTDPSDCIDIEPLPNFKGQWRDGTRYPSQYTPFNYSWSYVDNIVVKGNIFNNFTTLSLRYYVGDVEISDNKIYGRLNLNNSDGYIRFVKNRVYSTPNNANQKVVSNRAIIVGGTTSIRDDNNGTGYRTSGLGNKDCPEAVLMYENEFYNDYIVWEKVSFADVAYNKFYKNNNTATLRIRFDESDKSYKNVYIHDNNFENTREESYWKVSSFNLNPVLNVYNNTYLNNLNDSNSGLSPNLTINTNASNELSSITGTSQKVNYFKLLRPSNKQIYWVGETSPYNSTTFVPEGMKIGAYKLQQEQDGSYKKVKVVETKNFDVGTILPNVNSSANITINGNNFKVYIDNNDTDNNDEINPSILSNTTMSRIVITDTSTNKSYYVYQKLRSRTVVKEGNQFRNGYTNLKNTSYIFNERRSSYAKSQFNNFTLGERINIGDDISKKFNVYSVFYNISPTEIQTSNYLLTDSGKLDSRYGYAKPSIIPSELITWSIIRANGDKKIGAKSTIIEGEDFNSDGELKIKAQYLGVELTATIKGYTKPKTFINNSTNYEGIYDGNKHSININIEPAEYTIRYSINNTNYDLEELPMFKDVGEYIINYKVSGTGYDDLEGSNKVRIYGIKKIDSTISLKNDKLVVQDNSFNSVANKITTYSTSSEYKHYSKSGELIATDALKTGDILKVIVNGTKTYEYTIAFLGDTSGDGKINYLDYVNVYNHIQKTKHSDLNKKLLVDEYLLAADMSGDDKISYLDYVKIYNKIKELKGGVH